jgi:hypothetical protein
MAKKNLEIVPMNQATPADMVPFDVALPINPNRKY